MHICSGRDSLREAALHRSQHWTCLQFTGWPYDLLRIWTIRSIQVWSCASEAIEVYGKVLGAEFIMRVWHFVAW